MWSGLHLGAREQAANTNLGMALGLPARPHPGAKAT